ncbi:MAG: TonB family protein [Terriglobales bacterium]|jgi:TonB family protein
MSAAPAPAFEETLQRVFPRHPINVPLDLIALRSGVPENLPGRCTDLSETGVGAVVAGELAAGQQVAVELRLPNVGVPVRARALVRYQSRLRCGLEFVGLSVEQREMIRYWVYRSALPPVDFKDFKKEEKSVAAKTEAPVVVGELAAKPRRRVRIGRRGFYALIACMLALGGLGWWQWQRSWNELEKRGPVGESGLRVSPETMEKRIVTKAEPVYPEAARRAGTEGLVVLDAVIAPDGSVKRLRPVSGPDLLVQSATEAVQSWKFEPYLSSGKAVEVETTIAVEFRLN